MVDLSIVMLVYQRVLVVSADQIPKKNIGDLRACGDATKEYKSA